VQIRFCIPESRVILRLHKNTIPERRQFIMQFTRALLAALAVASLAGCLETDSQRAVAGAAAGAVVADALDANILAGAAIGAAGGAVCDDLNVPGCH
jgi:hypothetical protein